MAQRRSKNRLSASRRSSGNLSNVLNENSNVFDARDQLWFDRTTVRPSTSIIYSKNANSILSSDTSVENNESTINNDWHQFLSKSNSFTANEKSVEENMNNTKKKDMAQNRQISKNNHDDMFTNPHQKTKVTQKINKTKSGNSSSQQAIDESANVSNNSVTRKNSKKRPVLFTKKRESKRNSNIFDAVFDSDSSTKNQSDNATTEKSLKKNNNHNSKNLSISDNIKNTKVLLNSSQKQFLNVSNNSDTQILSKKRPNLFSKKHESRRKSDNIFDAVFDSDNSSKNLSDNATAEKSIQNKNNHNSENLSVSDNIKNTRVLSNSSKKQFSNEIDVESLGDNEMLNTTDKVRSRSINKSQETLDREKSFSSVEKAQLSKLIDEDIFEKSTSISKKLEHEKEQSKNNESKSKSTKKVHNTRSSSRSTLNNENSENNSKINKNLSHKRKSKNQSDNDFDQDTSKTFKKSKKSDIKDKVESSTSSRKNQSNKESIRQSSRNLSKSDENHHTSESNPDVDDQQEEDADTSSMPKNIRRTRSGLFHRTETADLLDITGVVPFDEKENSDDEAIFDVSISVSQSQKEKRANESLSNKSKDKQMKNIVSTRSSFQNRSNLEKSSDSITNKNRSHKRTSESQSNKSNDNEDSEEENNINNVQKKTKKRNSTNLSKSNEDHSSESNLDVDDQQEEDAETSSMPKNIRRTRSGLFHRSETAGQVPLGEKENSDDEAIFDISISFSQSQKEKRANESLSNKSKDKQMKNIVSTRSSFQNRSNLEKSSDSLINKNRSQLLKRTYQSQSNKSNSNEDLEKENDINTVLEMAKKRNSTNLSKSDESHTSESNLDVDDQQEEDAETSSMPKNIRRTRSGLFHRSETAGQVPLEEKENSDDEAIFDKSISFSQSQKEKRANESVSYKSKDKQIKNIVSTRSSFQNRSNLEKSFDSINNKNRSHKRTSESQSNKSNDNEDLEEENDINNVQKKTKKRNYTNLSKSNEDHSSESNLDVDDQQKEDAETSSMPKYIRRTKSWLQISKNTDGLEATDHVSSENNNKNIHNSSRNSVLYDVNNKSSKLSKTKVDLQKNMSSKNSYVASDKSQNNHETSTRSNTSRNSLNKENLNKSSSSRGTKITANVEKRAKITTIENRSNVTAQQSNSISETPKHKKNSRNVTRKTPNNKLSDSDDLLTTPHPAQSTLNFHGKPLTRITQYFHPSSIPASPIAIDGGLLKKIERQKQAVVEKDVVANSSSSDTSADIEKDVVTSDSINCQLLSRQPKDIPEKESSSDRESDRQSNGKKTNQNNKSSANVDVWAEIRKNTDKLKTKLEKQVQKNEQKKLELASKEANIQLKLSRQIKQEQAKQRLLKRKPLDKAYYVNGKPYKQPKLSRPKKWVTSKLYDYLGKHLEPKFGLQTRIRSEKFVQKLSEVFDVVVKRKLYENYKTELDDLMMNMAELGIINTRHEFWRFCSEFMPPSFKDKAVPMLLPGNIPNIPFDPNTAFEPLIG